MLKPDKTSYRTYCAGPLFNPSERAEMEMLAETLEQAGFKTFLPHRDGFLYAAILPDITKAGYALDIAQWMVRQAIFALDVYQVLIVCDCTVVNLNGRVPDEGAVAEGAMAWTAGKPVVLFKDDVRAQIDGLDNPLIAGLGAFRIVRRSEDLPKAVIRGLTNYAPPAVRVETLPTPLQSVVCRGQQLAEASATREVSQIVGTICHLFDEFQEVAGNPARPRR
jgi:nucleoside 2-deoxyribosyltransferase